MMKKILSCLGPYKKYALIVPVFMILEVVMEVAIPMLMSQMIDVGIANGDLPYIVKYGILMVVMALLSLLFGALASRYSSVAGSGLATGIRKKLFYRIQDFSFSNIIFRRKPQQFYSIMHNQ